MPQARQSAKRRRFKKAVPTLGAAAGLSLSLASGSPAGPAPHRIILAEEEVSDVSLATFYVFDKEKPGAFGSGWPLIRISGCCEFACLAGQAASENNTYSPQAERAIRPAHKPIQKRR